MKPTYKEFINHSLFNPATWTVSQRTLYKIMRIKGYKVTYSALKNLYNNAIRQRSSLLQKGSFQYQKARNQ